MHVPPPFPSELPVFVAAAVQAAPVFLDAAASAARAADLIAEAAGRGATLVVFPEVFIPGYPYWNWITDPVTGGAWFERLVKSSVYLPGPEVDVVRRAAARHQVHVVIGIDERSTVSLGTLWNTLVFIGPDGAILGRHRKLVPTWAEKLTWTPGDGTGLRVYPTAIGPLGGLACGENTNALARFALLAQGELVHAASYISLPVAPKDYDMAEAIRLRGQAHSFEGKVFTVVATSTISEEIIAAMEDDRPDASDLLERKQLRLVRHHRPRRARDRRHHRRRRHRDGRDRPEPLHPAAADARRDRALQPVRRAAPFPRPRQPARRSTRTDPPSNPSPRSIGDDHDQA